MILKKKQPRACLCSQKKMFFDIRQLGKTNLFSVIFTPLGAAIFLPLRFSELVNQSIHIDDIFPNQADRLLSQIAECGSSIQKVHIMEQYLIRKIQTHYRKE